MDIFEHNSQEKLVHSKPLADRIRPETLDELVGQEHAVGKGTTLRHAVEHDRVFSMILWGPPGCGKTTLAGIIASQTRCYFVRFSAVLSGIKDIRAVIKDAKNQLSFYHKKTILFVDEIHRFNKAQQDSFLHHVESGLITLIGATTENPSFEVIPALMSRCRVITLKLLDDKDIAKIINRALKDRQKGLGDTGIKLDKEAMAYIVAASDGDARAALNSLEITASIIQAGRDSLTDEKTVMVSVKDLEKAFEKKALLYDKSGEEHYNLISALHKSLRGSDPDGALYWLERMLAAGEDPFFIARRMVRFASEDIGNADPRALNVALNAMEAFKFLGHPEGDLALGQAALYLATAPKSNSVYKASGRVKEVIRKSGALPVPMHIRNAPTSLMKKLGYGKDYKYAHDYENAYVPQSYLPKKLEGLHFYTPTNRGYEKQIKQWLDKWRSLKKNAKNKPAKPKLN